MVWFKVDDGFYSSRKVLSIPRTQRLAAVGLWTMAGNWSARELTDGKIPEYVLAELGATPRLRQALTEARLWLDRGPAGVEFHNWAEYQPTREDVEAERAQAAERQRKWREKKRRETGESPVRNGVTDTVTNTVSNGAPTRPDPTRPIQTPSESEPRKRATSLPASWTPTDEHVTRAAQDGLDVNREAVKFRAYADEKGRTAKNWNAAFTRWLINAAEYASKNRPANPEAGTGFWGREIA